MSSPLDEIASSLLEAAAPAAAADSVAAPDSFAAAGPALPESLLRIPVTVQIMLGTVRLPLSQVAALKPGATVTLDQKLGTPVTILVNGKEVAKGELFVLDGEQDRLGVTITELAPPAGA